MRITNKDNQTQKIFLIFFNRMEKMLESIINSVLSGKKVLVLFIIILLPLTTFAQEKILGDINNQIAGKPHKISKQELNSKLVNEWGEKELKFLELKNGTLIPMSVEKSNSLLKIQDAQEIEPWVYVVITVVIVLIVFIIVFGLIVKDEMMEPLNK
jgi:hypothetical protein